MKRALLLSALLVAASVPALAAELPVKAPPPPPPPPPVYNWTGFYAGVNGGYSFGRARSSVSFLTPGAAFIVPPAGSVLNHRTNLNGGVAGGQIGWNWQINNLWVLGFEADGQWSGEKGTSNFLCAATVPGGSVCVPGVTALPIGVNGTTVVADTKIQWFGTARGRAGITFAPTMFGFQSALLYATGGIAFGGVKTEAALVGVTPGGTRVAFAGERGDTRVGWTVGGGIEASLWTNWTAKVEYLYVDLSSIDTAVRPATFPIGAVVTSRITDNVIRAGFNYQFAPTPSPVVARY